VADVPRWPNPEVALTPRVRHTGSGSTWLIREPSGGTEPLTNQRTAHGLTEDRRKRPAFFTGSVSRPEANELLKDVFGIHMYPFALLVRPEQ
jgi:hypothetical protein